MIYRKTLPIFKINKIITGQFLFLLGLILFLKMKTPGKFNKYDPHAILFLYYLGILGSNVDLDKTHKVFFKHNLLKNH